MQRAFKKIGFGCRREKVLKVILFIANLPISTMNFEASSMSCGELTTNTRPKSVSQKPKNYPSRNFGKAVRNFIVTNRPDSNYDPVEE